MRGFEPPKPVAADLQSADTLQRTRTPVFLINIKLSKIKKKPGVFFRPGFIKQIAYELSLVGQVVLSVYSVNNQAFLNI